MDKNYLLKMAKLINYLNLNSSETDEKISMEDFRTFSDEECKLVIEFNSMYKRVDYDNEIEETKALIKLLKTWNENINALRDNSIDTSSESQELEQSNIISSLNKWLSKSNNDYIFLEAIDLLKSLVDSKKRISSNDIDTILVTDDVNMARNTKRVLLYELEEKSKEELIRRIYSLSDSSIQFKLMIVQSEDDFINWVNIFYYYFEEIEPLDEKAKEVLFDKINTAMLGISDGLNFSYDEKQKICNFLCSGEDITLGTYSGEKINRFNIKLELISNLIIYMELDWESRDKYFVFLEKVGCVDNFSLSTILQDIKLGFNILSHLFVPIGDGEAKVKRLKPIFEAYRHIRPNDAKFLVSLQHSLINNSSLKENNLENTAIKQVEVLNRLKHAEHCDFVANVYDNPEYSDLELLNTMIDNVLTDKHLAANYLGNEYNYLGDILNEIYKRIKLDNNSNNLSKYMKLLKMCSEISMEAEISKDGKRPYLLINIQAVIAESSLSIDNIITLVRHMIKEGRAEQVGTIRRIAINNDAFTRDKMFALVKEIRESPELVPVSEIMKFMKKPDRLVLTDPCASNALVRYDVDVFELKPTELDDISSFIPTNVDLSKDSVIRIGYGIAPESDNRKGRRRKR